MSTSEPIRIGLVGCGAISTQHIEAIEVLEGTRLVGVVSASADRARAVGERHGVPWSTRLEDLLERDDVDAVTICTPSGMHPAQALAALRAGKHAVVEKPIALTVADADAVVREGRQRGLVVATISQRRFEPAVRALRSAVEAGALGQLVLIVAEGLYHRPQSYYDSAAWRGTRELDGGVLMNQAIHTVDLVRWIGGPVASVAGHVATLGHEMEAEDTASVSVRFVSGALGAIFATTCVTPEHPVDLRVYGDRGHVRLVGEDAVGGMPGVPAPVPQAGRACAPAGHRHDTHVGDQRGRLPAAVRRLRRGRPDRTAAGRHGGRRAQRRGLVTAAYEVDRTGRFYRRRADEGRGSEGRHHPAAGHGHGGVRGTRDRRDGDPRPAPRARARGGGRGRDHRRARRRGPDPGGSAPAG
jgi:predicted dehydrogenase